MEQRAKAFYELMVADTGDDEAPIFEGGLASLLGPYAELLAEVEKKLSTDEVVRLVTFGIALRQIGFRELLSGIEADKAIKAFTRTG